MNNRIQPDIYRHYFRLFNGSNYNYYYINSSNVVATTASSTPIKPLNEAPVAWDEEMIKWDRGLADWALFRKWGETAEFTLESATILRYIYFNQGVQGKLQYYVEKFNVDETVWDYEEHFAVDIDFGVCKNTDDSVTVKFSDSGFNEKLVARTNTAYEMDVENNPDVVWVHMHGIHLQFRIKWLTIDSEDVNTIPTHFPLEGEGTNLNIDTFTEDTLGTNPQLVENNSAVAQVINLTYSYNYNIFIPGSTSSTGGPFKFHLFYEVVNIAAPGILVASHTIFLSPTNLSPGQSATYTGSNTNTINLLPGQRAYVVLKMLTTTGPSGTLSDGSFDATQLGSELLLTLGNVVPEGYIPALRATKVMTDLLERISEDSALTVNSGLLDDYEGILITSGDALRILQNSKMKITWTDFYDSVDAILGASFKYDKTTNTTELGYFADAFDNTDVIDFGEVSEFECEPFAEVMFGKLKNGFDNFTYDEVNGKDEFNNETEWLTPITRIIADKVSKSKIRADMYGIELTRLNLSGKEITDADTDNDLFFLHIEDTSAGTVPAGFRGEGEPYYNLYMDPGLTITNIYSPETAFNILFSPKRCLLRKGNWLHSILAGLESEYIKFQTNSKSNYTATKMITDDGATIIDEGEDILIGDLPDPVFLPHRLSFKAKVPNNINAVMNTNPFGKASFTHKGNEFKGFFLVVPQEITYNSPQRFQLLSTTDNDLTKLIY